MGGASTEITDATTNVLIEAANFDPISIARTARRHKLRQRGVQALRARRRPAGGSGCRGARRRAARRAGWRNVDELGSDLLADHVADAIDLPDGYAQGLIGVDYTADEITDSLQAIGATVESTETGWSVTPPSWRPDLGDKTTSSKRSPASSATTAFRLCFPIAPPGRGLTRAQRLRRTVSNSLAASGLTEVLAYPFISQHSNDLFGASRGRGSDHD